MEDEKDVKKEEKNKVIGLSILITIITALVIWALVPIFKNLNFGLDLQGGFEVLYKVSSIDGSSMTKDKLNSTYKTLGKRIDSLGVSEPEIIIEGNDKIRVKLAGVTNEDEARKQLSTVATLSFRDASDNLLMTSNILSATGAKLTEDSSGNPAVLLSIKDKDKFYSVTNKIKDQSDNVIVIWLDYDKDTNSYQNDKSKCGTSSSNCLSAATVSQAFASDVIIQGNFEKEEAQNLVDLINSGSLPSKLTEISSRTVGASFGDETLQKTLVAGVVGIAVIIIFLVCVYHFCGFISLISMMFYTFFVFVIFWTLGGVLTLPGIAALVLGIGMAVDANVITYARIKDELYKGRDLKTALKMGEKNSFRTIIDSNLTTLLVAIIMFYFGESSVKGFATMLIITIVVTMFTMVFLTRLLLNIFIKTKYFDDKTNLFIKVKKEDIPNVSKGEKVKNIPFKNVNFFKYTNKFVILSCIVIVLGFILIGVRGLNLGIDYQAGSDISITTTDNLTKKTLKAELKSANISIREIEVTDQGADIKVNDTLSASQIKKIKKQLESKYNANVDIGVVSNIVKKELTKNAIISIILSMLGIIIYVSIRFKFTYAIGGVVALIHDVLMMVALFSIFHLEISVMFIAAILAIVGYSINDTIVCFDRIRENLAKEDIKKLTKERLKEVCNISIRETFLRSIYTTITTLIPVIFLILLGSREVLNFNLAMLFGLISGTYSSIFIATALFMVLETRDLKKPKKNKVVYTDNIKEKDIKGINC